MNFDVAIEVTFTAETFSAFGAAIGAFPGVNTVVGGEVGLFGETFAAVEADIRTFSRMNPLMCDQG